MSNYDFTPDKPDQPEQPAQPELELDLADPHATLVKTGYFRGVLSLKTGKNDPILQSAAVFHADFQAQKGKLGHQHWDMRSAELFKALPEHTNFREVAAMSWAWEMETEKGAGSIFDSWRQSPPHWRWVNGACDIWGYAMKFNSKLKLWFATGIFADRR